MGAYHLAAVLMVLMHLHSPPPLLVPSSSTSALAKRALAVNHEMAIMFRHCTSSRLLAAMGGYYFCVCVTLPAGG